MVKEKDVVIVMQARMGSERLPGKVLKKLKDKSLLGHVITRLNKSHLTQNIIMATSTDIQDELIEKECREYGVKVFRGSNSDVLARFYEAARKYNAKHILRFCCDNPFADYRVIDRVIQLYTANAYDYFFTKNYPLGIGVEVFSYKQLESAYLNGHEPYHREHVTPYIIENAEKQGFCTCEDDYSDYRFTVDTEQDWIFTEMVYNELYNLNSFFGYEDIIKLLNNKPEIREINRAVEQKKYK